ncbi:Protein of unknown function [Actinopolyspora saharensis]|uniref:DUF3263 domain-containing protein n=2 Tax=Actinopolyspora saharensis TaxID=995062 RepID=A0A1H1EYQ7_9ACTN|nr:Protein of unknown function [Actinopolyspora saharensis]
MDAAQMLTAHEIARQCQQRARTAERPESESGAEGPAEERPRGHLRAVEPMTQPIERVPEQARGSAVDDTGEEVRPDELTEREREVLAFERQWWKGTDSKERAVRELFALTLSEYRHLLDDLLDKPAAMRSEPMLIKRLRRERRSAAFGSAPHVPDPYGSS